MTIAGREAQDELAMRIVYPATADGTLVQQVVTVLYWTTIIWSGARANFQLWKWKRIYQ